MAALQGIAGVHGRHRDHSIGAAAVKEALAGVSNPGDSCIRQKKEPGQSRTLNEGAPIFAVGAQVMHPDHRRTDPA